MNKPNLTRTIFVGIIDEGLLENYMPIIISAIKPNSDTFFIGAISYLLRN